MLKLHSGSGVSSKNRFSTRDAFRLRALRDEEPAEKKSLAPRRPRMLGTMLGSSGNGRGEAEPKMQRGEKSATIIPTTPCNALALKSATMRRSYKRDETRGRERDGKLQRLRRDYVSSQSRGDNAESSVLAVWSRLERPAIREISLVELAFCGNTERTQNALSD